MGMSEAQDGTWRSSYDRQGRKGECIAEKCHERNGFREPWGRTEQKGRKGECIADKSSEKSGFQEPWGDLDSSRMALGEARAIGRGAALGGFGKLQDGTWSSSSDRQGGVPNKRARKRECIADNCAERNGFRERWGYLESSRTAPGEPRATGRGVYRIKRDGEGNV